MNMESAVREFTTEINLKGNTHAIVSVNVDNNNFDCKRSWKSMTSREVIVMNYEEWKELFSNSPMTGWPEPPDFMEICNRIRYNNS